MIFLLVCLPVYVVHMYVGSGRRLLLLNRPTAVCHRPGFSMPFANENCARTFVGTFIGEHLFLECCELESLEGSAARPPIRIADTMNRGCEKLSAPFVLYPLRDFDPYDFRARTLGLHLHCSCGVLQETRDLLHKAN